jgi:hypothetical protein
MKIRDPPIDITGRLAISTAAVKLLRKLPPNLIGLCQDDFKGRYPTFNMAVQSKQLPTVDRLLELFKDQIVDTLSYDGK